MPTAIVGVVSEELPAEQASVPGAAVPGLEFGPPAPDPGWQVATFATEATIPGVVRLSGRVMLTLSPTAMLVCCEASKATCTRRVVEVAFSTVWPGRALSPGWAATEVTRTAMGSNTARPKASLPFWATPTAAWSFSTAAVVAAPKKADPG